MASKNRPGGSGPNGKAGNTSWLVHAKLLAPAQFVPLINRASLLPTESERMPRLTLIQAPAGYGKSTLLAQWRSALEAENTVTCWFALEEADSDPSQFLIYLAHTLHYAGVDVSSSGLIGASAASKEDREIALRAIAAAVLADGREVVVILDDFEQIDGSPASAVVERLLAIMPPNMHLALASRRRVSLKISRLRAQGQACEITARELRFSHADATALLGSTFSRSGIRILLDKTEGWPAALQLARHMIVAQGTEEASALVAIAGRADEVGEFIAEQVIFGLPDETRAVLRDLAPFGHFDAPISDYLRERDDSARILAMLGDLNPLVSCLGDGEPTYRLHPMIAEYLHVQLTVNDPERLRYLHARAAQWYDDCGSLVEALRHAARAERPDIVRRIIETGGGIRVILTEGMARTRLAFRHVPASIIATAPRIALVNCVLLLTEGKYHQAMREYERIKSMTRNFSEDRLGGDNKALMLEARFVELYLIVHGDVVASEEFLASLEALVLQESKDDPGVSFFFKLFMCLAYQQRGAFVMAERALRDFEVTSRANALLYGDVFVHLYEGMLSAARGGLTLAAMHYKRAQRVIQERYDGDEGLTSMMANTLLAEIEFERNDLERAHGHIAAARRSIEHAEGWFDIFAAGHGIAAKLAFVAEGLEGAMRELDLLENVASQRGLKRVRTLVDALRMRMLMRADEFDAAADLAHRAQLDEIWPINPEHQLHSWRERDAVGEAAARLAIQGGRYEEARVLIGRIRANALEEGRNGSHARMMILLARLNQEQCEIDEAVSNLAPALEYAAGERVMRPFLDEGEPMAMLIELSVRDHADKLTDGARAHAAALFEAFRKERETAGGVQLFSQRQRQIIIELGKGQSNKEIARALDLSEDAVKYHLKKIFGAFGVDGRKQAIAEARRQSLIP